MKAVLIFGFILIPVEGRFFIKKIYTLIRTGILIDTILKPSNNIYCSPDSLDVCIINTSLFLTFLRRMLHAGNEM